MVEAYTAAMFGYVTVLNGCGRVDFEGIVSDASSFQCTRRWPMSCNALDLGIG